MSEFMQYWRTQEQNETRSAPAIPDPGRDGKGPSFRGIGVNGPLNMTATEELARHEPDFETSDEDGG